MRCPTYTKCDAVIPPLRIQLVNTNITHKQLSCVFVFIFVTNANETTLIIITLKPHFRHINDIDIPPRSSFDMNESDRAYNV